MSAANLTPMEGCLSGVIAAAFDDLLDVRALLRAIVSLQEHDCDAHRLARVAEVAIDAVLTALARHA
jgi:hypothetical protein